jgi:lipopolysaccharide/colanic/teichoic acid biosynthesis glycosyltransferase
MLNYNIQSYGSIYRMEHSDAMGGFQLGLKRIFDVVLSLLGIVVLSPLFVVISIILFFSEGGHIIYRQERVGYKGKPFKILKFRTMRTDAELNGIPRLESERNKYLTPLGLFLRVHHLDELPQLLNVLKGDMSFVGPRPERQFFIDQINLVTDDYRYIYLMRPGLTSYATIYNGYTDTMEKMLKRLEYDLDYLDNRSVFTDLKILIDTLVYCVLLFFKRNKC